MNTVRDAADYLWTMGVETRILPAYWRRRLIWIVRRRLLGGSQAVRLPSGRALLLPAVAPWRASDVFATECAEDWGTERLLRRFLDRAGDFLDCGAHIGYYALYCADLARRVYAFEPDERPRAWLERSARLVPNIVVVPKAVVRQSGIVRFAKEGHPNLSHVAMVGDEVPAVSLDDFARDTPDLRVSGIKLDIECYELDALQGATALIARDHPLIATEYSVAPGRPNTRAGLMDWLGATGDRAYAQVWRPRARTLRLERIVDLATPGAPRSLWDTAFGASRDRERPVFKMLVLAPPRLHATFDALAQA